MARNVRRRRRQHPGVSVFRLPATGAFVARWRDPLTRAQGQQSLTALNLTSAEARTQWCIAKSEALSGLKASVAIGAAVAERKRLADAVEAWYAALPVKGVTAAGYRAHTARLLAWMAAHGTDEAADVAGPLLARYRDDVVRDRAQKHARGEGTKRGGRVEGTRKAATLTMNKRLTVAGQFLNWARARGWCPGLTSDAIRDGLRPLKVRREAIKLLAPAQLRELLAAALRHDAACFALTREEHEGRREVGTTPRHEPIAPFVLLLATTGMRFREALELEWREVNREAKRVELPAERVKTGHARHVDLAVSPTALELLEALRLRTRGERVFPELSRDVCEKARARLVRTFGAPPFLWQMLRRSASAILSCSNVFGGGSAAYLAARRHGHSVVVAESKYAGLLVDLPKDATTFEAAAGIETEAKAIVAAAGGIVRSSAPALAQ